MMVVPAIDILDGRPVRLLQGDFAQRTDYAVDIEELGRRYREAGARRIHLVELGAARGTGARTNAWIEELASLGLEVDAAGGIRSLEDARAARQRGAARVVVGTAAFEPGKLDAMLAAEGAEALVVALDLRGEQIMVEGWLRSAGGLPLLEQAAAFQRAGVRQVLYTDVLRDGTLRGPNLAPVRALEELGFAVGVAGGVGSAEDLALARAAGASWIVVGKALMEGAVPLTALAAQSAR